MTEHASYRRIFFTMILVASGVGRADWPVAFACVLITGGAVLAAKDLLFEPARRKEE